MHLEQLHVDEPSALPSLKAVSVVVPCFNESGALQQLSERLRAVEQRFAEQFQFDFILVDDGSSDETWQEMHEYFSHRENFKLVKHESNQGIAAAIRTGFRVAQNDIVVSMDADCTYDPMQIGALVEALHPHVSIVTASPYHPDGEVVGIPKWRLLLSRSASTIYAVLIGQSLHTYTSCFRAYRRSAVIGLPLDDTGFVGVAELLWQASRHGNKITECPTRLTSRRVGFSKMRTLPVILKHGRLMRRIIWSKLTKKSRPISNENQTVSQG